MSIGPAAGQWKSFYRMIPIRETDREGLIACNTSVDYARHPTPARSSTAAPGQPSSQVALRTCQLREYQYRPGDQQTRRDHLKQ